MTRAERVLSPHTTRWSRRAASRERGGTGAILAGPAVSGRIGAKQIEFGPPRSGRGDPAKLRRQPARRAAVEQEQGPLPAPRAGRGQLYRAHVRQGQPDRARLLLARGEHPYL